MFLAQTSPAMHLLRIASMFPNVTKHVTFDLQTTIRITFTNVCTSYFHVTFEMFSIKAVTVISIKPEAKYGSRFHAAAMLFTFKKTSIPT
jgi:hypothetical protein